MNDTVRNAELDVRLRYTAGQRPDLITVQENLRGSGRAVKVLQLLSNPAVGGTETFVVGLVPRLNQLGLDVQITNLWDGGGEVGRLCRERNIPFKALNGGTRRFRASAPLILRKFLRERQFDIVTVYGLRAAVLLRLVTRFGPRVIRVTGVRSLDKWRRWYHVWPDRLTERKSDYCVGVSRSVCRRRVEREKSARVLFIPNGIDTEYFRFDREVWPNREALRLPPGRLCVTVANFQAVKGHAFQLKVIERLKPLPEDVHFVWVGTGEEEQMLRRRAAASGLADRIIFYGHVDDVRPVLAHCSLFFLSSKDEGMPRALMEGMAIGLPVLATDVAGNKEVVRDSADGLVIPYGDVESASAALGRLLDDAALRQRFGTSAAQRIRDEFSFDYVANRYAELYRRLVAGDPAVERDFAF
jgi:glycosyltransferase involved in cell wall biosynthesis